MEQVTFPKGLKLAHTEFVLSGNRFEIYLSGCSGINGVHCDGCHNPQTWDFNYGEQLNMDVLLRKANKPIVASIWLLGGEPLDNALGDILSLLNSLRTSNKPIWLFTRYEFDEVPNEVKELVDVIKTGRYISELSKVRIESLNITLGSSNQKMFKKSVDKWEQVVI